jgi:solute carrier family 30 (zinc transporter), member 9
MPTRQTTGLLPVLAALLGNILVTVIKFFAAVISGSSALFSEAVHSFADTSNQILLLIGLRRSRKKPDDEFIYGYGNERFFWALISACGIFFIGAGITTYNGIIALLNPKEIEFSIIIFMVLLAALIIESITFFLAVRELMKQHPEMNFREHLKHGDPSTLAVLYEDGLAVVGVLIASASLILSWLTGNRLWDACGSIAIGLCLGVVAIILIIKNRSYLMGKAIPEDLQDNIISILEADPAIEKVIDFKSTVLDIGIYRIKCEIEFNGNVLFQEIYKNTSLKDQYDEVKDDYEEFKKFCVDYADRIPRLVGRKIDEIEKKLKMENPAIKYIDIEIN